jgi:1-deoxy-D-xylulose-5-phosphate synthase
LIAYGALVQNALAAADELIAEGVSVEVIDARFCKPIDGEMLARVLSSGRPVLTIEDHSLQNGFGSAVIEYAVANNLPTAQITRLGMPDRLIPHATRKEQLAEVELDPAGILKSARDALRRAASNEIAYQPLAK